MQATCPKEFHNSIHKNTDQINGSPIESPYILITEKDCGSEDGHIISHAESEEIGEKFESTKRIMVYPTLEVASWALSLLRDRHKVLARIQEVED